MSAFPELPSRDRERAFTPRLLVSQGLYGNKRYNWS